MVDLKGTALSISELGFGKKTPFKEYRLQSRGGKGTINLKVTDKNGPVVKVLPVADEDEVILVTTKGQVVRCPVNQIRTSGRNAQGVRVIRLKEGHKVAMAARVVASEDEDDDKQLDLLNDKKK